MWITVRVSLSLFKTMKPTVLSGLLLSWLERTPDMGEVGSSSLPRPTNFIGGFSFGALAQLGEHLLCKQGVTGSIPVSSTMF